jgi:hypothetical protein
MANGDKPVSKSSCDVPCQVKVIKSSFNLLDTIGALSMKLSSELANVSNASQMIKKSCFLSAFASWCHKGGKSSSSSTSSVFSKRGNVVLKR